MQPEIKRTYYENGKLEHELTTINGKRHGAETWYHVKMEK